MSNDLEQPKHNIKQHLKIAKSGSSLLGADGYKNARTVSDFLKKPHDPFVERLALEQETTNENNR